MSKVFKALEQASRDQARPVAPLQAEPPARSEQPASGGPSPFSVGPRPVPPEDPRSLKADRVDPHLVSLLDPVSYAAEQYRNLRHLVEQAHRAEKLTLLAVSSPSTGDGKTTTAINLAGALAQGAEARVLLVEADLRHPTVGRRLALPDASPGLVGGIHNTTLTLGDVVRPCPPFNLNVLPAGSPIAAPYELLKSPRLGQLLEDARLQYDYVVIDTPPLVPIPDCRVIGRHVDSFLVVVAAHRTSAKLLDEALAVVPPSKNIGLLFNGGQVADATYGYGYGSARIPSVAANGTRPWFGGGRSIDRLLRRSPSEHHEER
jgi:capsular exopolysaccharide synthesis family protein